MSKATAGAVKQESSMFGTRGIGWLMLVYFCSGVCSLMDEVVWVRLLKLTLGNTAYASSIVVSVFMGGLALGALIMGRYADKIKRRLRLYAILEILATVSALSLPWLLRFADIAYRWFFVKFEPSRTVLMVVQVIVSALVLLIPTMLMGSTLPLLARHVTDMKDRVGRLVGRLYALNMLGAVLGCFIAGFVLIRMVGVMGTLYIAAGINLLVALGGWILSRFYDVPSEPMPQAVRVKEVSIEGKRASRFRLYILMAAFFVSGFVSIGYELIWMRSIVVPLGGFTYVFSSVLTVYLLGNVIGAGIGSRLSKFLRRPAIGFGISLAFLGVLGIFYLPWLSVWQLNVKSQVSSLFMEWFKSEGIRETLLLLFHSTTLFILPAITMGIGFPLALQAWSNYRKKVGQSTGTVYGVNTIGAVLGGAVTGFVLIPLVGTQLSITVLGMLAIWLGILMIESQLDGIKVVSRISYLVVAVILTATVFVMPLDLFEKNIVNMPGFETLAVQEGVTTTVSVQKRADGRLELASDGVRIAGDDIHRSAQKMLGHLGVFLHKDAKEVLSIGFGGGETTACLSRHDLERLDCVEIAPEVVEVALKFFRHINLGDELEQKVNMTYADAKNYLHLTDKRYDIIINGADVPSYSGSAPMFAIEHFENSRKHLKRGGLFITKLHLGDIAISNFNSILGTFLEAYPHVTIWFPTTKPYMFFYLVGSDQQQVFSPGHIESELSKEDVTRSVEYLNFDNSFDVFSCYIGDETDIRRYLKDFRINSDYKPYVEFNFSRRGIMLQPFLTEFTETVRQGSLVNHIDWTGLSDDEARTWRKRYEVVHKASNYILKSHGERNNLVKLQNCYEGLKLMPDNKILIEQENQCLSSAGYAISKGLANEVILGMNNLLQDRPDFSSAWLIRSWALQSKRKMDEALKAAEKAAESNPYNVSAQDNLGLILLRLNQADKAIEHYTKAVEFNPAETRLRYNLGMAFERETRFEEAVFQFHEILQIQPRNAEIRCRIGDILVRQGHKEDAIAEYNKALEIEPKHPRALMMLKDLLAQ